MTTGLDIIQSAEKYKGVPYFEGNPQGVPPAAKGMDCSGLVQRALSDIGISVSRTTASQFADAAVQGKLIGTDLSKAQQGDVIHYVGHEEIWIGNGNVFSESVPGTTADIRARTPWPIVGIARYADGGPGNIGGTIVNAPTDSSNPLINTIMGVLNDTGLLAAAKTVADIGHFLTEIVNPSFWGRVAVGFFGLICMAIGLFGLSHHPNVINVTSQMVRKGAQVASSG